MVYSGVPASGWWAAVRLEAALRGWRGVVGIYRPRQPLPEAVLMGV